MNFVRTHVHEYTEQNTQSAFHPLLQMKRHRLHRRYHRSRHFIYRHQHHVFKCGFIFSSSSLSFFLSFFCAFRCCCCFLLQGPIFQVQIIVFVFAVCSGNLWPMSTGKERPRADVLPTHFSAAHFLTYSATPRLFSETKVKSNLMTSLEHKV